MRLNPQYMVDDFNWGIFLKWVVRCRAGAILQSYSQFQMRGRDKGSDKVPEQLLAPGDRRHPAAAATAQAVEQANRFILIHTRLMAQFSTTAHFFRCIGHSLRSREHPCLTHPPRGPAWANGCRGEATEKCAPVTRSRYICQQFCNILVNFKAAPKKHHSNS